MSNHIEVPTDVGTIWVELESRYAGEGVPNHHIAHWGKDGGKGHVEVTVSDRTAYLASGSKLYMPATGRPIDEFWTQGWPDVNSHGIVYDTIPTRPHHAEIDDAIIAGLNAADLDTSEADDSIDRQLHRELLVLEQQQSEALAATRLKLRELEAALEL